MAIEDHYNTPFTITMRTKTKVDGRYKSVFVLDPSEYLGAIFTPTTVREVVVGKETFNILKTLYCSHETPIQHGDFVTIDGEEFDIGNIKNTNNLNHHYQIGLIQRVQ